VAKTPRYRQIAGSYRDRILAGEMRAGARLPTRREIMSLHGTSRATADKVMEILHAEGLTVSVPRAGTQVADLRGRGTSLADRMASLRSTGRALARNEASHILKAQMVACPPDIASLMGVQEGDEVLIRERVTSKDGIPVAVSRSFYTKEVAELTPELLVPQSIPSGSRELAAERMGSEQDEGVEHITSRMSSPEEMELLDIGRREETDSGEVRLPVPVTQVARIVTLADGRIVEVAIKVTEGSRPVTFRSSLRTR
jgi:DNA-binding GntR family transcriptional regulator